MKPFLKISSPIDVKTVALAVCLSALPQLSQAAPSSSTSASKFNSMKIVPSLGYTYFNIQGAALDPSVTNSSKGGSSAGVLVQLPMMGKSLELETGLEYLETGAKQSADLFSIFSITLSETEINHIAIPVRAKYNFNPSSEGTQWYGKAGLTPTFVMTAKNTSLGSEVIDIKSDVNPFGVLTQAGIVADWALGLAGGRVSVDFSYNYGLTKVFKDAGGTSTGYLLQAGYIFSL